jgi:hypothetical protein
MKADMLEREFASRAVGYESGLLLLRPADAIELVNRAADEGVPILGIEGTEASARAAQAPLKQLADYSAAVAEGHGCWEEAETFIRGRGDRGFVLEVRLGDDPIEAV